MNSPDPHRLNIERIRGVGRWQHQSPTAFSLEAVEAAVVAGASFDATAFLDSLHAELKDNVAGYSVALHQKGRMFDRNWQWANGSQAWTSNVRMHIASCSKLITAVAMIRLLADAKISLDANILPYLPAYWTKGPGVDSITFRQLLTHTSGLQTLTSDSDIETMKNEVAKGVNKPGTHEYRNYNYGLCRILLATIHNDIKVASDVGDTLWDLTATLAYVNYVNDHIFQPAGVIRARLEHDPGDALAYPFPVSGNGWNSQDLKTLCGAAGWHLSSSELLKVLSTVRRGGAILSSKQCEQMLNARIGIDEISGTDLGPIYNKDGWWGVGGETSNVEQSVAFLLPGDVEIAVLVNSPVGQARTYFWQIVLACCERAIKV